jgi:flagellar motor switch protein FliN/FliY
MSAKPQPAPRAGATTHDLTVLHDITVTISVEIAQAQLTINDLLELKPGAVFELNRPAGAAGDIRINGRYVARGDIMNCGDKSGVRITEIVQPHTAEAGAAS